MTRETKVGLLVGLGMILLIGIIVSDHLSVVSQQEAATLTHFADGAQKSLAPGMPEPAPPLASRQESTHYIQSPASTAPGQQQVPLAEELRQPQEPANTTNLAEDMPRRETYPQRAYALHERPTDPASVHDMVTRDRTVPGAPGLVEEPLQDTQTTAQLPPVDNRLAALNQNGDFVPVRNELDRSSTSSGPGGSVYQMGSDTLRFREGPAPRREEPQRLAQNTTTLPIPTQTTVVVKSGQTLTAIAKEHLGSGNRWKEIFELNRDKLDSPESLQAGMEIRLPKNNIPVAQAPQQPQPTRQPLRIVQQQPQKPQPVAEQPKPKTPAPSGKIYTVQDGDTLTKIAKKTMGDGKHWKRLYEANKSRIGNPDSIEAGVELMIPQS